MVFHRGVGQAYLDGMFVTEKLDIFVDWVAYEFFYTLFQPLWVTAIPASLFPSRFLANFTPPLSLWRIFLSPPATF